MANKMKYESRRVYIGASLDEWVLQRNMCGEQSNSQFAKHLLAIHKQVCRNHHELVVSGLEQDQAEQRADNEVDPCKKQITKVSSNLPNITISIVTDKVSRAQPKEPVVNSLLQGVGGFSDEPSSNGSLDSWINKASKVSPASTSSIMGVLKTINKTQPENNSSIYTETKEITNANNMSGRLSWKGKVTAQTPKVVDRERSRERRDEDNGSSNRLSDEGSATNNSQKPESRGTYNSEAQTLTLNTMEKLKLKLKHNASIYDETPGGSMQGPREKLDVIENSTDVQPEHNTNNSTPLQNPGNQEPINTTAQEVEDFDIDNALQEQNSLLSELFAFGSVMSPQPQRPASNGSSNSSPSDFDIAGNMSDIVTIDNELIMDVTDVTFDNDDASDTVSSNNDVASNSDATPINNATSNNDFILNNDVLPSDVISNNDVTPKRDVTTYKDVIITKDVHSLNSNKTINSNIDVTLKKDVASRNNSDPSNRKNEEVELAKGSNLSTSQISLPTLVTQVQPPGAQSASECSQCKAVFHCYCQLAQHVATHVKIYPFKCSVCSYGFVTERELVYHFRDFHPKRKALTCPLCSRTLKGGEYIKDISDILVNSDATSSNDVNSSNVTIYRPHGQILPKVCSTGPAPTVYLLPWRLIKGQIILGTSRRRSEKSAEEVEEEPAYDKMWCTKCMKYVAGPEVKEHLLPHLWGKLCHCKHCIKGFSSPFALEKHMMTHMTRVMTKAPQVSANVCGFCHEEFQCHCKLSQHLGDHFDIFPHRCKLCSMAYSLECQLTDHMVKMHPNGKGTFCCKICGEKLRGDAYLTEEDLGNWKPPVPQKRTKRTEIIEEWSLLCPWCGKLYQSKSSFDHHIYKHTGLWPFICQTCGKGYPTEHQYNDHVASHSDERPFGCDLCSNKFKTKFYLQVHKRGTHGEKRFSCEKCGDAFKCRSTLKSHRLIHTARAKWQCPTCGKSVLSKETLRSHQKKHTSEPQIKCDKCDKVFRTNASLKRHSMTHTTERPHKCQLCDESFRQNGHLKTHMMKHTGEWSHKCSLCPKGFGNPGHLDKHMKSKHRDQK